MPRASAAGDNPQSTVTKVRDRVVVVRAMLGVGAALDSGGDGGLGRGCQRFSHEV
jgi:hypothetical protein